MEKKVMLETLNRSKQHKINDENKPGEQKQQSKTLLNHKREEDQWT